MQRGEVGLMAPTYRSRHDLAELHTRQARRYEATRRRRESERALLGCFTGVVLMLGLFHVLGAMGY